ncbi:MAG: polyribonucleotide nucleotidyltransferase [Candidatus Spechtbacterales bacterium]|nr:polyribonucleotide nucleotidyltransferase [Candidatus Spechtbacterales bacterium]
MEKKEYSMELGGKTLTLTFNNWAEQTSGSVLARYGDTVVLTTAVMSDHDVDMSYFPLMVNYREKYYAAGFIGGGRFMKREGRPSDEAVLKARLIDRTLRPLFNHAMRREVQVVNSILSYDPDSSPDIIALIASSLALHVSDIPWDGPIGGVRVSKIDNNWIINPSSQQQEQSNLTVTISGPEGKINMIETEAKEAPEEDTIEAMRQGQKVLDELAKLQDKIRDEIGKEKQEVELKMPEKKLQKEIREFSEEKIKQAIRAGDAKEGGKEIYKVHDEIKEHFKEKYEEKNPEYVQDVPEYLDKLIDELVHQAVLEEDRRVDGRGLDEVRPLSAQTSLLPRTHGSGLFMRGLTHGLSTATLDSPGEEELAEEMEGESKKRFMLHYNFPQFSTGGTGFFRAPGRREIGHGALAEKAVEAMLPDKESFPYVIRVVTEILSSNGSTSMASVCSASLALMDAGVPVEKHVAGIAMGLMMDNKGKNYKILTDIQGPEDHYGDMDFKVAGTRDGVNAIQMDVKIGGVTIDMLEKGLKQAKDARLQILDVMEKAIAKPKPELSQYAPVIEYLKIDPETIGMLIGPGGKMIKEIMAETNTEINVEDDGSVYISGEKREEVEKASKLAENITREIKVGEEFDAKVVKIADFGAFVELVPGQEALVHISELADGFVKNVEDVVKAGERIHVKVIKIDESGKIGASVKAAKNGD